MSSSPRTHRSRIMVILAALAALVVALSGCVTEAQNSASAPTAQQVTSSAAPTSSSPSSSEAPTSSETAPPTSAAPETSAAPTSEAPATDQPTVVYLKAASSIGPGESVKVTLRVETPNPGIPFGDVTLLVGGSNYASGTLDAQGNLNFTLKNLEPGNYKLSGKFHGNATYAPSTSQVKNLKVLSQAEIDAAQKEKEEQQQAAADNPCPAKARACIDLTNNLTWLQENGVITYGPVKQIAGRAGWRTPPGTFTVQWKNIDHKSSIFNNAPMPYAIFFNGGIAFHEGSLSTPSHGCIHLSNAAAKVYWDNLYPGDIVYVFGEAQY